MTIRDTDQQHPLSLESNAGDTDSGRSEGLSLSDIATALAERWKLLAFGPLAAGAIGLGATYLVAPTFTAVTTFMPPQQSQSSTATALGALGALGGLAAGAAGLKSPAEQYVALMQSVTVSDRLIDQFKLMSAYDTAFRVDARKELAENVRISVGKKGGLITVEVDDKIPQRPADIANRYVEELRRVTSTLAVTEAQQRRVFFEQQLKEGRERLVQAQLKLQASGFNPGALKAEPKAAAEAYARLKAEATAAEVRLQGLRGSLADSTPEVRQQQSILSALREQLARMAQATETSDGPDYIGKFREFKYQETLFELYARQFELAKVDESREGALIQVVDPATPPEKKSKPKRGSLAISIAFATALFLAVWVVIRYSIRTPKPT